MGNITVERHAFDDSGYIASGIQATRETFRFGDCHFHPDDDGGPDHSRHINLPGTRTCSDGRDRVRELRKQTYSLRRARRRRDRK